MIKIGIVGFGNIGKAVSEMISNQPDMEIVRSIYEKRP